MTLRQLEGKNVRLVDIDGDVFEGYVGDYMYPDDDNPEGIILDIDGDRRNPIGFFSNDIRSVKIIPERGKR